MSLRVVACPECRSTLRLDAAIPTGAKVRCPRCATVFALWSTSSAAPGATPATEQSPDNLAHAIATATPRSAAPGPNLLVANAPTRAAPHAQAGSDKPVAKSGFRRAVAANPWLALAAVAGMIVLGGGVLLLVLCINEVVRKQNQIKTFDVAAIRPANVAPPPNEDLPPPIFSDNIDAKRPPLAPIVEQKLPQDMKAVELRYQDLYAWNQRTLVSAYDAVGKKDPRWDGQARQALEATARFFSRQLPAVRASEAYEAARAAIRAGCNDPLIYYIYARSSYVPHYPGEEELEQRYMAAANALEESKYPPFRRLIAFSKAAHYALNKAEHSIEKRSQAERFLKAALNMLVLSAEQDEHNQNLENVWTEYAQSILNGYKRLLHRRRDAFDHVDARLAQVAALKVVRLKLRAEFMIHWGWDARGDGFAHTVKEDGWTKFRERLDDAGKALEHAWKLQSNDSWIAAQMLIVERAVGHKNKRGMQKWFELAMQGDPAHHREACYFKLLWLAPKWHGSRGELLAFGKECRDTKNWRSGVTLMMAQAHHEVACSFQDDDRKTAYMQTPEVWADIKAVYEEYLQHFPHDDVDRSRYAGYCYWCGQYAEAHKQFEILGDDLLSWPEPFDEAWMKRARDDAADKARIIAAEVPAKPDPKPEDFVGKWVGEWDGKWYVQFTVSQDPATKQLHVLYEWEEKNGEPVRRQNFAARLGKATLVIGAMELSISAKDDNKGKAVGKFKSLRIALLTRQPVKDAK